MEQKTKPQLHQSHLSTLYRCGHKFDLMYLQGIKEPPTTPLLIGTATHAAIAHNLTNKIEKGTLLTREAVQDLSRDEFIKTWNESPVTLNEEERFAGLQKTRDNCQDVTIELSLVHHYSIAPKIKPTAVERKWVLSTDDRFQFDMAGTIDIDEIMEFDIAKGVWLPKPILKIRDTKTRARNLGQREVDSSEQYSFYHFAKFCIDGIMADKVVQDNLIKPTKGRPAIAISYESERTQDDHTVVVNRFAQACNVIQKGSFTPANPSDWWCSKDFCGFAAEGSCKYFNSKRKPTEQPKGDQDGRTGKELIDNLKARIIDD